MMSDLFEIHDQSNVSDLFDQDHGVDIDFTVPDRKETVVVDYNLLPSMEYPHQIFDYHDPLKHVYKFQFKPFHLNMDNIHFVNPHYVEGYVRKDGTIVEGYFRDGDGDTSINRTIEQGGGYFRTNPDNITANNLNK
jgi:hypothetical protein